MKWLWPRREPKAPFPTPAMAAQSAADAAPGPSAAALPAGHRIADWRIERLLARGATGALYAATDTASEQLCALKVWCPIELPHDAQSERDRFLREARGASRLDHPHIVHIDAGGLWKEPWDELAFLVMELLPGRDLWHYTNPQRRLPEALVIGIGLQLAGALDYAHRHGIVHRDVKPSNVMFDPTRSHAWLTDFGLARLPNADHTRSGVMLGSPAAMAPELLAGDPADARTDFYALGVLLFELLTSRLPYEGNSLGELLQAIHRQPRVRVGQARPDLPAGLAKTLDDALAPLLERDPMSRAGDGAAWASWASSMVRDCFAPRAPGPRS
jgi:eukaryotic-like serine/threonine-protein kinase